MTFTKFSAALVGGLLALIARAEPVCAQVYPNRPIKLLVPFTPGGGTDLLARVVAQKMSESLGQPIIVDNRPGGNTLIATEAVVHAAPDGYTLIMQTNNLAANPTLYQGRITFDTLKDLAPVSLVAGNPHVLVVNPSVPAKNLKEFIALAKAKPGTISFASAGSGTVNHLAGEQLKILAGIDMMHVPYKGSGIGDAGSSWGTGERAVRRDADGNGIHQEQQAARDCGHHSAALSRPARRADDRRIGLSGLLLQLVVWHPRPGGNAQTGDRPAAGGGRESVEGSQRAGTARRLRDLRLLTR